MNAIKIFLRPTKVTWRMFTVFFILFGVILYVTGMLLNGSCTYPTVMDSPYSTLCNRWVSEYIAAYLVLAILVYVLASGINRLSEIIEKIKNKEK